MFKKKGGKSFGVGAYGAVYGNPTPPCKNNENINKNEVGKVFISKNNNIAEENANKEYNIKYELKTVMTSNDFQNFESQYAVLPKKKCEIDKIKMQKQKYIYNNEWKKTVDGEQLNEIDEATKMILYDKAEMDMHDHLINKMKTFHDLKNECKKLQNVFRAIKILHHYKIIHFDLKIDNIVMIQNKYKIIDFGKYIKMEMNPLLLNKYANIIGYFAFPSSTLYFLYDQPDKLNANNICSNNNKSVLSIHNFLYIPFALPLQNQFGFDFKQKQQLEYYCKELYRQKYFGYMGFYEAAHKNIKDKSQYIIEYKQYIEIQIQQNTLFPNNLNPSPSEQIYEIYEKIDIYSLGIILLCILKEYYIKQYKTQTTQINKTKTRKIKNNNLLIKKECKYIMQIYDLAFQCCNYMQPPNLTNTILNNKQLYFTNIETLLQKLKYITQPKNNSTKNHTY